MPQGQHVASGKLVKGVTIPGQELGIRVDPSKHLLEVLFVLIV